MRSVLLSGPNWVSFGLFRKLRFSACPQYLTGKPPGVTSSGLCFFDIVQTLSAPIERRLQAVYMGWCSPASGGRAAGDEQQASVTITDPDTVPEAWTEVAHDDISPANDVDHLRLPFRRDDRSPARVLIAKLILRYGAGETLPQGQDCDGAPTVSASKTPLTIAAEFTERQRESALIGIERSFLGYAVSQRAAAVPNRQQSS